MPEQAYVSVKKNSRLFLSITLFLIALLLLFGGTTVYAQREKVQNLPNYDRQKIHFGFLLGINTTDFVIGRIPEFNMLDTLYSVESEPQTGFNLGIIVNFKLSEHFDLRFVPDLSFSQRNLNYSFHTPVKNYSIVKNVESTFLEFPLDLKFKSKRVNNYRVYVLAGAKYTIDMVSQAKVENKDKQFVKLEKKDYGYEIGLGFDFYLERFKFSPEIKMFHGLNNLLVDDSAIYSTSLKSLRSKIFVFSITFE
ncbi:MAG TPA: porin family protein [Bacteroidia bacterium]|nr:porin family protein [Bacteroidia bacterium]